MHPLSAGTPGLIYRSVSGHKVKELAEMGCNVKTCVRLYVCQGSGPRAHPGLAPWTPLELSRSFYERIAGEKELVVLEGSGHFPYKEPGLSQMEASISVFQTGTGADCCASTICAIA